MPEPLNYEPRDQSKPEPPGPSDRAGWIIAGLIIFFIISGFATCIT